MNRSKPIRTETPCIFPLAGDDQLARLVDEAVLTVIVLDWSQTIVEKSCFFPLAGNDHLARLVDETPLPVIVLDRSQTLGEMIRSFPFPV